MKSQFIHNGGNGRGGYKKGNNQYFNEKCQETFEENDKFRQRTPILIRKNLKRKKVKIVVLTQNSEDQMSRVKVLLKTIGSQRRNV